MVTGYVGFDEEPGPVADGRDRLSGRVEALDEGDSVGGAAKLVGVRDSAWEEQGVVVGRIHLVEDAIDGLRVGRLVVVDGLDLAGVRGDQLGARTRLVEGAPGSISSIRSTRSVATIATLFPSSRAAMVSPVRVVVNSCSALRKRGCSRRAHRQTPGGNLAP